MFKNIIQSTFLKHILTLVTGSAIAQVIPLLAEPVLSRLYSPAEFGTFEIYISFVLIVGSLSTLRYEMAIVLPKEDRKGINLLGVSLLSVIGISLISLIIVLTFKNDICIAVNNDSLRPYLIFVPFGILIFGLFRGLSYWSIRKTKYKLLGLSKIFESGTKAGASIWMGFEKLSSMGLILGSILGHLLSLMPLLFQFIKNDLNKISLLSRKLMTRVMKEYDEFPKVNMFQTLLDMIQISGIIILISFFFEAQVVGAYGKAFRILMIPLTLIGTSISQVFYQKSSEMINKGENIVPLIKRIFRDLALIPIIPLAVLFFFSPQLFAFVLGKEWYVAGEYATILIPWIYFKFLVSPISVLPMVLRRQQAYLIWSIAGNILLVGSVVVGGILGDFQVLLILLSGSQVLFSVFLIWWLLKIAAGKHSVNTLPEGNNLQTERK